MNIETKWTAFEEPSYVTKKAKPRVTLSPMKKFCIGAKAFRALGSPDAVLLYFDIPGNRIGMKKASLLEPISVRVTRCARDRTVGYVSAGGFCNQFRIRPEVTIEFNEITFDKDGMMILDLNSARRFKR